MWLNYRSNSPSFFALAMAYFTSVMDVPVRLEADSNPESCFIANKAILNVSEINTKPFLPMFTFLKRH